MRVGVLGAGAIGCYVGGRLASAGHDVVLVGRERLRDELAASGLWTVEMDATPVRVPDERISVALEVEALAGCDVVLLCTKSGQTREAAESLRSLPAGTVVSLQNGVSNPPVLREVLPDWEVVPGIVGFNVVWQDGGRFVQATTAPIQLGGARALADALAAAGLEVEVHANLAPHQWTKLLVNLSNAVSALSGAPTVTLLETPGYRRVMAAIVEEACGVLRRAGIRPAPLRGVPICWMPRVLRLPTWLVRLVLRRQLQVDPEARSSMWQDLDRGRRTEVDHLNGEIVGLSERVGVGLPAPLNARVVQLVREAEAAGGSPNLDPDTLWTALQG